MVTCKEGSKQSKCKQHVHLLAVNTLAVYISIVNIKASNSSPSKSIISVPHHNCSMLVKWFARAGYTLDTSTNEIYTNYKPLGPY